MASKSVIYIDSIFLNRALCYTFTKYSEIHQNRFTDQEWDENINRVNLSKFIQYVIEYNYCKDSTKYGWLDLRESREIDVFVFKLDDFYFSYDLHFDNPVMHLDKHIINLNVKTVHPAPNNLASIDFDKVLSPFMDLHISKQRILKNYQSLCIISIDKHFNSIIDRFVNNKFPVMRYKIAESCDIAGLILEDGIKNSNVFSQDIKYPIARMWGLTSEECTG